MFEIALPLYLRSAIGQPVSAMKKLDGKPLARGWNPL